MDYLATAVVNVKYLSATGPNDQPKFSGFRLLTLPTAPHGNNLLAEFSEELKFVVRGAL